MINAANVSEAKASSRFRFLITKILFFTFVEYPYLRAERIPSNRNFNSYFLQATFDYLSPLLSLIYKGLAIYEIDFYLHLDASRVVVPSSVSERVVAKRKERGKFCFFLCQPAIKRSSVVYLKFARRRLIGRRSRRRRTNNNGNSVERASRHATGREGKFVNAFNHLKQEDLEKCDRLAVASIAAAA